MPRALAACALALALAPAAPGAVSLREGFPDVLRLPGRETSAVFTDLGAWHGFALPAAGAEGGFVGPFVHGDWVKQNWLSPGALVRFAPEGPGSTPGAEAAKATLLPGLLRQTYAAGSLGVVSELIFIGARTAAGRVTATNLGSASASFRPAFDGTASFPLLAEGSAVRVACGAPAPGVTSGAAAEVRFDPALGVEPRLTEARSFRAAARAARTLEPGAGFTALYTVSFGTNASELRAAAELSARFFASPSRRFAENEARWDRYLSSVLGAPGRLAEPEQRVLAKALETLVFNWRGALGAVRYDGCQPSAALGTPYSGFWAWDSWKHAAALAAFDPRLAADQVRLMLICIYDI